MFPMHSSLFTYSNISQFMSKRLTSTNVNLVEDNRDADTESKRDDYPGCHRWRIFESITEGSMLLIDALSVSGK